MSVTIRCDNSLDESLTFVGIETLCLVIAIIVECFVFGYLNYQTCYVVPKVKQQSISKQLTAILHIYHWFVLLYLIGRFIPFLITSINGKDLSDLTSCYNDIYAFIAPGVYHALFIIFWNTRLNVVFADSVHQITKLENIILLSLVFITLIIAEISLFIALFQAVSEKDKNNVFCLAKQKNIDFYPYLFKGWTDVDSPFYECEAQTNILDIATIMAAISVPLLNLIIAIQYIRKMYLLFNSVDRNIDHAHGIDVVNNINVDCVNVGNISASISDQVDQDASIATPTTPTRERGLSLSDKIRMASATLSVGSVDINIKTNIVKLPEWQRKHIYRNGFIAIFSAGSTLMSLILFIMNSNLIVLVYFDAVLNGILMMTVFQFGQWMFDTFCVMFCKRVRCCICGYKCCCKWHVYDVYDARQMKQNQTNINHNMLEMQVNDTSQ